MQADLTELEKAIGYDFADSELLCRALTHYSHVYESLAPGTPRTVLRDNEQLEFLGDAILGFVTSEFLLSRHPSFSEGKLHELKAWLVSSAHLVEIARLLNLGSYLFLGRGEEVSGGRQKRAMLADAFEALIAAVYLDGGMEAARKLIHKLVLTGGADGTAPRISPERDYKTGLQELARARGLPLPEYRVVRERGPEHAKTFTVEVRLGPTYSAQADGPSKKGASQDAARRVYLHLTEDGPEPAVSPPR